MSKYVIEDTTLTGIGDAIRAKSGSSDLIPVSGLADAITALSTGGGSEVTLKFKRLTNTTGVKYNQVFDATGYVDETTPFFISVSSSYLGNLAMACYPCVLFYDGNGTFTKVSFESNTFNVGYIIQAKNCKVEGSTITIGGNGSSLFNLRGDTSATTNYAYLYYLG